MRTPLEFWKSHKRYIQGLLAKEPNGIGLQAELDAADSELAAIANGTYQEPVILHCSFTIDG